MLHIYGSIYIHMCICTYMTLIMTIKAKVVGNKAKGRILRRVFQDSPFRPITDKTELQGFQI